MTSPAHQSGTDRIAEVARRVERRSIVVNVQGDEPEIEPETIDGLIERLETSDDDMATAATPFPAGADPADPESGQSRDGPGRPGDLFLAVADSVPPRRDRDRNAPAYYLHLGIYAYRRDFLLQFASWPPTPLETDGEAGAAACRWSTGGRYMC